MKVESGLQRVPFPFDTSGVCGIDVTVPPGAGNFVSLMDTDTLSEASPDVVGGA